MRDVLQTPDALASWLIASSLRDREKKKKSTALPALVRAIINWCDQTRTHSRHSLRPAPAIRVPTALLARIDERAAATVRAVATRARRAPELGDEALGWAPALLQAATLALPRTVAALLALCPASAAAATPPTAMLRAALVGPTAADARPGHARATPPAVPRLTLSVLSPGGWYRDAEDRRLRALTLTEIVRMPSITPEHVADLLAERLSYVLDNGINAETLRVLVAACAPVARGWRSKATSATLLHSVADCMFAGELGAALPEAAEALVAAGADVNARARPRADARLRTPLGCAASRGSEAVAAALVGLGGAL